MCDIIFTQIINNKPHHTISHFLKKLFLCTQNICIFSLNTSVGLTFFFNHRGNFLFSAMLELPWWCLLLSFTIWPAMATAFPKNMLTDWGNYLITQPLEQLYLHGPAIYGVGFWEGKDRSTICSEISGPHVTASFWLMNPADCELLIQKRTDTFLVNIFLILYVYMLIRLFHCAVHCFTYTVPRIIGRRLLRDREHRETIEYIE